MCNHGNEAETTKLCWICRKFHFYPPALAVDRGTGLDVDLLCAQHRALAMEGYCVICGRRAPAWKITIDCVTGWCRPCFVDRRGEDEAREAEASWARYEGRVEGK